MANLIVVVDPDPGRRRRMAGRVGTRLVLHECLVPGEAHAGDLWVGWAAAPRAPLDVERRDGSEAGGPELAVVWGRGLPAGEARPSDAASLRSRWAGPAPDALDGYHAGLVYGRDRLTLGCDRLGVFPLYYAVAGDVLLAGTSPRLFALHPSFRSRVDPVALVGIFLAESLLGGRALLEGVRRLAPGHLLVRDADGHVREEAQYAIPAVRSRADAPFAAQVDRLHGAVRDSVARHLADAPSTVLLSGGRDSRMLAGYAVRVAGGASAGRTAFTVGRPGDYEVRYARRVARRLGLPFERHEIGADAHREAARLHARWELLGNGISHLQTWDMGRPLAALSPRVLGGYLLDGCVGGTGFFPADFPAERYDFDRFSRDVHRRAFAPERLRRLLRPEYAGLVDELRAEIRRRWESAWPEPSERLWRYETAHAERHQIGGMVWRVSFGAWPLLPVLDGAVLETVASLSTEVLAQRRAQDEILRTRFPRLARIPLVHKNDEPMAPLIASPLDRAGQWWRERFGPEPGSRHRRRERRVLWRASDFDGPGWREVRRLAEPGRDALAEWFDMDEVAALLPGPEEELGAHTFFDAMGLQLLIGLILVEQERL